MTGSGPSIDVIRFIETMLVDPETERLFVLNRAERRFLARAFELTPDGRLKHPELLFSAPKKSGKTGFAAMIVLYVVLVLGGRFAEAYCVANDLEQSQGRVFQAIRRIVEVSPALAGTATITASKITFAGTGATITAIASDFAGAAGANPTITVFDELWGVTTERGHRLWDEMVPPPTRRIACRLTVTYAGFEGESVLLEDIYKRGLAGEQVEPDLYEQPGMLCFWTHDFVAPWQTDDWREQMRAQLRPNAFLRLVENRWVSSESTFVDMAWWDACVDPAATAMLADRNLPVWVGVDASVKRDSTAVVACAWDHAAQKVRLIFHRIFQPSATDPLDFEASIENTISDLARRFSVREVKFDPYQMQAVSQRLMKRRIPMTEFPQTVSNLTEASTNLYELIKAANLIAYADDAMRLAVQRSVAIETSRGWRIAKEKASHKIDVVVALGMAALGAVQSATIAPSLWHRPDLLRDGGPADIPQGRVVKVFATAAVDDAGRCAICFWARTMPLPAQPWVLLLDYTVEPISAQLFRATLERLLALASEVGARQVFGVYAEPGLVAHAHQYGLAGEELPQLPAPRDLSLAAAKHVHSGRVGIVAEALDKSNYHPLGALLDAAGDFDDPLRIAGALGILLACDETRDGIRKAA